MDAIEEENNDDDDGDEKLRHVEEENLGVIVKFDEFDVLKWGFDVRSRVIVGCD